MLPLYFLYTRGPSELPDFIEISRVHFSLVAISFSSSSALVSSFVLIVQHLCVGFLNDSKNAQKVITPKAVGRFPLLAIRIIAFEADLLTCALLRLVIPDGSLNTSDPNSMNWSVALSFFVRFESS